MNLKERHIAIVIPVHNEENTITDVVSECKLYGTVFVVNDGSTDESEKLAIDAGGKILRTEARGYETALNLGLRTVAAQHFDIAVTIDGDGEHPTDAISEILGAVTPYTQIVIAERTKVTSRIERLFAVATSTLLKCEIKDPLSGMKAYNLNKIPPEILEYSGKWLGTKMLFFVTSLNTIPIKNEKRVDSSRISGTTLKLFKYCITLCAILINATMLNSKVLRWIRFN